MRLVWVLDAGLPTPLCNPFVYDRGGRFVGSPDLVDPIAGLVAEYDGYHHRDTRRRAKDVVREEAFRALGLEYVSVEGGQLGHRAAVAARMLATRRRALWLPAGERRWVAVPRNESHATSRTTVGAGVVLNAA